ncbi:ABC transporter permease, partial [Mesorhizobium sp. M7A.T.Ca.US.000.02.1.1]
MEWREHGFGLGKDGSSARERRMTLRDHAIRYGFIVLLF